MSDEPWVRSPIGDRDRHWSTLTGESAVVLAPHIVALARLDDLIPLIESDYRVQRVYTVPESDTWPDVSGELRSRGEIVLPARQAAGHEHGLVLAGSTRGIDDVRGPAMLVPHGSGFGQYRSWRPPSAREDREPVTGLDPGQLLRNGRVRAETIVLTHDLELDLLARYCPQAVPNALVAGDIAFDRLVASVPFRSHYRHTLDVPDDRQVVLVVSTWSPRSGFGIDPRLFRIVVDALPRDRFRVIAALHPLLWSQHGTGQVRGWLSDAINAGLDVLTPRSEWRGAVVAADYVMGDYSSVTAFAAGLGKPVLRVPHGPQPLLPGSPAATLAEHSPLWDSSRPLVPQLRAAAAHSDGLGDHIAGLLTSRPGQAAAILRAAMYHMLRLSEPTLGLPRSPARLPSVFTRPNRWQGRDHG